MVYLRRMSRLFAARRARVFLALLVILLLVVTTIGAARHATLRALGGLLIVNDPIARADIGVMTESGEAGELELSDLYRDRVIPRVMVLIPTPTSADQELVGRGVYREDQTLATLVQLGIPPDAIVTVDAGEGGTTESTQALAAWVTSHPARVLVVVSPTHSRRYRRTLQRVWPADVPRPIVRYPRANPFHAEDWWVARRTRRDGILELEKLVWDYLQHPW